MTYVAAAAVALPPHRYAQAQLTDAFARMVLPDGERRDVLQRLHAATTVESRHLALPLERYPHLDGFGDANDAFLEVAADLGERAIADALRAAGVTAADVDTIMSVSVTGVGAPSIEARLAPRLGLREGVKRIPIFGLGCVAGAAGLARLHDLLRGNPDGIAVLLAVELCSLTLQRDDPSLPNLVASGLFGDGAAAVVLVGDRLARRLRLADRPRIVDTRSRLYPDTERVMGWDIGGSGFRIVLAASVADVVEQYLGEDVDGFLAAHDLKVEDIDVWLAHPGGPKVLEAMQSALRLPHGALAVTWRSLAEVGNLSSVSVLHVLAQRLAGPAPPPGTHGVLLAMGPGFCAELVLLRW